MSTCKCKNCGHTGANHSSDSRPLAGFTCSACASCSVPPSTPQEFGRAFANDWAFQEDGRLSEIAARWIAKAMAHAWDEAMQSAMASFMNYAESAALNMKDSGYPWENPYLLPPPKDAP